MTVLEWLILATGFTGALTLVHLARLAYRRLFTPPSAEVHFSPKGNCTDIVVRELKQARHEVLVLAYSFTSRPIAEALIDAEHAIAHNKVMIIDQRTLLTGSFNFTNQAEHENAENLLVLKGHADLVHAYRENFQAHKAHARAAAVKTKAAPARAA